MNRKDAIKALGYSNEKEFNKANDIFKLEETTPWKSDMLEISFKDAFFSSCTNMSDIYIGSSKVTAQEIQDKWKKITSYKMRQLPLLKKLKADVESKIIKLLNKSFRIPEELIDIKKDITWIKWRGCLLNNNEKFQLNYNTVLSTQSTSVDDGSNRWSNYKNNYEMFEVATEYYYGKKIIDLYEK